MNENMYREAIERLMALPTEGINMRDVAGAFMGSLVFNVPCDAEKFRSALIVALRHANPSNWGCEEIDGYGLVRLPVDARGETIRVGDMLQYHSGYGGYGEWGEPFKVEGVTIDVDASGWEVYNAEGVTFSPATCRHYHKPTVDDVMSKFEDEWNDVVDTGGDANDTAAVIIKYADELRELLKEDEA